MLKIMSLMINNQLFLPTSFQIKKSKQLNHKKELLLIHQMSYGMDKWIIKNYKNSKKSFT
jgi:hypothetical protein